VAAVYSIRAAAVVAGDDLICDVPMVPVARLRVGGGCYSDSKNRQCNNRFEFRQFKTVR
jgi:hypothetical protein